MNRVTLGICTFRRPEGLQALFASLARLIVPEDVEFDILVVDNDGTPSSEEFVADLAKRVDHPVRYFHEPEPGIPSARNRVLDEARGSAFLLFVDDDETVTPDLLVEHLKVQSRTGAGFVQGPCHMTVADASNAWWLGSVFFMQRDFPDGAPREESWTNNVLIDLSQLDKSGVRFDDQLRYSGGSDTLFFQDFVRAGAKGTYAAHAIVEEVQSANRLTWKWAMNRQFRYGVTRANTLMLREAWVPAMSKCVFRATAMFAVGLLHLPTALVRGRIGLANSAAYLARGTGVILGAVGFRAEEYARN